MLIRRLPEEIAPQIRTGVDAALAAVEGGDFATFLTKLSGAFAAVRAAGWNTTDYIAATCAQHDDTFPMLAATVNGRA